MIVVLGCAVGLAACANAPAPPALPSAHIIIPPLLHDIHIAFFDRDAISLTDRARWVLDEVSTMVVAHSGPALRLRGYADRTEAERDKQALSLQRATAVADELVRLGVPRASIDVVGQGEKHPLIPNVGGTEEAQNRRVEIMSAR